MKNYASLLYPDLQKKIEEVLQFDISNSRKSVLQHLIDFVQIKINEDQDVNLNFICTHNSRRSQFSQLWAKTAAFYYGVPMNCYSGGVEETAFNECAVSAVRRCGFEVSVDGIENPRYTISFGRSTMPLIMYSKLYSDEANPSLKFAAVMTCSDADENCPFIPGSEKRIALLYDDPKEYDGTAEESAKYDERSKQIAGEMFYVFSKVDIR